MSLRSVAPRLLLSYARPEAFADKTQSILARLGYRIIAVEDYEEERRQAAGDRRSPDLLIVDESRLLELEEVASEESPPIILLTGRHGVTRAAPRIVGAVKRPAGLHDLYRLAQQIFEETPRTAPRVSIQLPARCRRAGSCWDGALLSLSENGGLLRSGETLPLGACFRLAFELPGVGELELRAEAAYQLVPDLGVVFSGLDPAAREAIGHFVSEAILA